MRGFAATLLRLWGSDGVRLFALGLLLRIPICLWAWDRVPPTADGHFYHIVAERIAEGQGYTWLWPDGVVTHAAHYPVGYPLMMGGIYALLGPLPGWVMLQNAVLGAASVSAVHRVCHLELAGLPSARTRRWASIGTALLIGVGPTFLFYTAALMTEVEVASLSIIALCLVYEIRKKPRAWLVLGAALLLGWVVLLRPQTILLVPVLGALCVPGSRPQPWRRLALAAAFALGAFFIVLPWTARNCQKMQSCVFVSANGGWNLLIGTFPEGRGAWVPLTGDRVPPRCREVYREAAKDSCFGRVGREKILSDPGTWLSLVPAKLQTTFDYFSPASDHLREAGALEGTPREVLRLAEQVWERSFVFLAFLGTLHAGISWPFLRSRASRVATGALAFLSLLTPYSWILWVGLLLSSLPEGLRRLRPGWVFAQATLLATLVVHGVFFGAARYAIVAVVALAPLASWGLAYVIDRGLRRGASDGILTPAAQTRDTLGHGSN